MPEHIITNVVLRSPAWISGIRKGDMLCKMQDQLVYDQIDYQALSDDSNITLSIRKSNGIVLQVPIIKEEGEALGLSFGDSMKLKPKDCDNNCIFCFVDQMPKGLRDTLYVKDDDWRFSLMMGNYITLTNISEKDFERIVKRKPSPLYISVHATDGDVRRKMMRNPNAANIMERLKRLAEVGIKYHTQLVLCPGINDGKHLKQSLDDLSNMPSVLSVAVVPIGITKHRSGLARLRTYTQKEACEMIDFIAQYQKICLNRYNTKLIFCADEWYVLADREIPNNEYYEDYPQIENGVGLLRLLENELRITAQLELTETDVCKIEASKTLKPKKILVATGVAAEKFIRQTFDKYKPSNTIIDVTAVTNDFFGDTVTVAALITGIDLINHLKKMDLSSYDEIWISETMIMVREKLFLDGMSFEEACLALPVQLKTISNHGDEIYDTLWQK